MLSKECFVEQSWLKNSLAELTVLISFFGHWPSWVRGMSGRFDIYSHSVVHISLIQ